jgi:hypothetical protein
MQDFHFNISGLLRLHLIGATSAEALAVQRQIGCSCAAASETGADLTIRWVDRLITQGRVRILGDHDVAYTDNAFMLLRGKHKRRVRVQIPFDTAGSSCEIVCERGATSVPLLVPIINLTMLGKGIVPVHASAFAYEGCGVLAAGWSKGGKTETLLSFLAQDAEYIADDWVYIDQQGQLFGIPEPVRLRPWHLDGLPKIRRRIGWANRLRLAALGQGEN